MRRRELLTLAAGTLATAAGCLESSDGAGPTATQTPSETPTATDSEDAAVSDVAVDSLQPGLIELGTPDSISVFGDDRQFLFLDVTPESGGGPDPSAFAFVLDGETYTPIEETRRIWRRYNEGEGAEYAPNLAGWLLFDLPATADDASTAHLTWPDGSWEPDEAIRERLASPTPAFDVTVEVPETVAVGESPSITLSVENTGSVPARFLAAINRSGPNIAYMPEAAVRPLLDAGESHEWTGEPSFHNPEEISAGDTTRLTFDWVGGETDREVDFVAE